MVNLPYKVNIRFKVASNITSEKENVGEIMRMCVTRLFQQRKQGLNRGGFDAPQSSCRSGTRSCGRHTSEEKIVLKKAL